jgi:hypothetical protein
MTTYKLQKGIMGTHNVAVLKDDVTSIPLDEANADYQRYLEDLKTHGMYILTCTDCCDGDPDKSMWQYADNAEQLVIDKYGSDSDKLTALREDRYVRAMKAKFPYESKDEGFKIIDSTSEEIKQKYRHLPMRR